MMVQQNKWRATRFGSDARLVNSDDYKTYSVQETTDNLVDLLLPIAKDLDCLERLESVRELPKQTGADQQLEIFAETNSRKEVVQQMLAANHWAK